MTRANTAALLCSITVAACVGEGGAPVAPPAVEDPRVRTLVIGVPQPIDGLIGVATSTALASQVLGNLNTTTFKFEFDRGLRFTPNLAIAWSLSTDGTTLAVVLRDDIRWSDGPAVTAADVQFTYALAADPATASSRAAYTHELAGGAPCALNDTTLIFRFTKPKSEADALFAASFNATPRHALALPNGTIFAPSCDLSPTPALRSTGWTGPMLQQHPQMSSPTVSGPFRLAAPLAPAGLVLEPNPHFSGPADDRARLGRVEFRVLESPEARRMAFVQREIDMISGLTPFEIEQLRGARPDITVKDRGRRVLEKLAFRPNHPLLGSAAGRRAIAAAIDVDALIRSEFSYADGTSSAERALGVVSPLFLNTRACASPPAIPAYDPAAARAGLAALGWVDTDGDRIVDRDGERLRLRLVFRAGQASRDRIIQLVVSQLQAVGVEVLPDPTSDTEIDARLGNGEWDLLLNGLEVALKLDPRSMLSASPTGNFTKTNPAHFRDPTIDERLPFAVAAPSITEAEPIWCEVQARYAELLPELPMWWRSDLAVLDSRFDPAYADIISTTHDLQRWDVRR